MESIKGYPILDEYRYLGVIIDRNLSFIPHLRKIEEKAQKGIKMMKIMKWKGMDTWKIIYAWITYVVPHYRYGALIFMPDEKKIVEGITM